MFRAALNLSSHDLRVMEKPPWETKSKRPVFSVKAKLRKWQLQEDTKHVFFTLVESSNPHHRVESDNPPSCLYGWVADYDADITSEEFLRRVETLGPEERPTHFSRTFSGGIRAVWEFEEKVWVDCPEVAEKFMRGFAARVKAVKLAPGLDTASYDLNMLWELGTDWQAVEDAMLVPRFITQQLQVEAITRTKKISSAYEDLPLDLIQAEIEKQYPGRLFGADLELGARIPLFWLPICGDGKEKDKSGIVAEWGIHSFSSRSEKGNMFWDELLGREFVEKFQEKKIGEATEGCYFDGVGYWRMNHRGNWVGVRREDALLYLKVERGLTASKKPKETASEAEKVLYAIQAYNRIDAAAPFTHTKEKFVDWNGERYLNINQKHPMQPGAEGSGDPDNFPWMYEFVKNFFHRHESDEIHPREYFLAELRRKYVSFLHSRPVSSHCLVLVGPTGKGKSFLNTFLLREIFGSATDAGKFLVGGRDFTKELAESVVWYVDDNESASTMTQHKKFSEAVKKHVATPEVDCQPKFKDARIIPWYGLMIMSCNEDPDSVSIIPDLDINIQDKVAMFRINDAWQARFLENVEQAALVRKELPFFLRWLVDVFVPDERVLTPEDTRYGIFPYKHPDLVETARESSSQYRLAEVIDLWREQMALSVKQDQWEGNSSALLMEMQGPDSEVLPLVRGYSVIQFGKLMGALHKQGVPWLSRKTGEGNKAKWVIEIPRIKGKKGKGSK